MKFSKTVKKFLTGDRRLKDMDTDALIKLAEDQTCHDLIRATIVGILLDRTNDRNLERLEKLNA